MKLPIFLVILTSIKPVITSPKKPGELTKIYVCHANIASRQVSSVSTPTHNIKLSLLSLSYRNSGTTN